MRIAEFVGAPAAWDDFVRAQPGWTHFHLWGWKEVIHGVLGHQCLYLAAFSDSVIEGVLPLVRVKSLLFGHYLVSMPFLNYGGPLGTPNAVASLAEEAVQRARAERVDLLELRCREELDISLPISHRKVMVLLELPPTADALWERLTSKVRSQVRRPKKEGIEVRFGTDQIDPFYRVFRRHMRDLGTPVLPLALFKRIAARFGDDVWVGCAYLGDEPVAAGFGLRWGDELEMTWASALRTYNRMAPNMLLYWSFIERACDESIRTFNFGRCTPGGGTHRFKIQWGSREEPLWWYGLAAGSRETTPQPDDSAYAWGPKIWRRLPLPLANALGPRVVRYVP